MSLLNFVYIYIEFFNHDYAIKHFHLKQCKVYAPE